MPLNKGITVRLEPAMRARLERIAERSGVKAAVLIRQAVLDYCNEIESRGKISFSINGGVGHRIEQNLHLNEDPPNYGGKKKGKKK